MEISTEYWNTLANQFVLISSLLGGFSITVVANLIGSTKEHKVIDRMLKLAAVSSGCFLISLFAMTQISLMTTPGGYYKNITENSFVIQKNIGVITFMFGLISLLIILCLSGYIKSRKTGIFTTIVGIISLILICTSLIKFS